LVILLLKAIESTSTMAALRSRSPASSDSSFDDAQRLSDVKWTSTDNEEEEEAFKALRRRERELKKKFHLKEQAQRAVKKKNSSADHHKKETRKRREEGSSEGRSSNERDNKKRKREERNSSAEERMSANEEDLNTLSKKKKELERRLKSARSRDRSLDSPNKRLAPVTLPSSSSEEIKAADAREKKRNHSISKFLDRNNSEKKHVKDEKDEENQSSVFQTALRTLPNFLSAEDKNTIMYITHKRRSDPVTIFETMKKMLKKDEEEEGRPLPSVVSSLIKRASAALKQGPPEKNVDDATSTAKNEFVGGSVLPENIDRQVVMKSQEDNVQLNIRYLLGRNWEIRSGLIELTGVRNRGINDREDLPVISIVRKPKDPTKHKNYTFNIPYKQVKNIHSILQGVIADFEPGEELSNGDLERIKVEDTNGFDEQEELYDFNKLKMRGFKHKVYIAYPYEAQVCWYSYHKGKGGKKTEEGENVYEVLQLRKSIKMIEELNNKAHETKNKFFDIVIPTSNIHRLALVFSDIHNKLGF